jgi:hypothetical protein
MSISERFAHEGDTRVCREERDEIEAALDCVERGREALKALARQVLAEIYLQRRELLDRRDPSCRTSTRPIEMIEAAENLADAVADAFNDALDGDELERARTIIETGSDL